MNSTPKLFALDEEDLNTILASLSLGTRKLVKAAWLEQKWVDKRVPGSAPSPGPNLLSNPTSQA